MTRDGDGHRNYKVTHLVESSTGLDGPANAIQTPGLPLPGTTWQMYDDVDVYAWFRSDAEVSPHEWEEGEKVKVWAVSQTASTRPPGAGPVGSRTGGAGGSSGGDRGAGKRCDEVQIENPLSMPDRVSGGYVQGQKEYTHDLNGSPIVNSAFEKYRGDLVTLPSGSARITIEQNRATLELPLLQQLVDHLNEVSMWGLPRRSILFAGYTWSAQFWATCLGYYTRLLEFHVKTKKQISVAGVVSTTQVSGWDLDLANEGSKALRGRWVAGLTGPSWEITPNPDGSIPDGSKPSHFTQYVDRDGKPGRTLLRLTGEPVNTEDVAFYNHFEVLPDADLMQLSLPVTVTY
jgi:hypothetical protein